MYNGQATNAENPNMLAGRRSAIPSSSRLASFKDFVNKTDYRTLFEGRKVLQPGDPGYVEGSSSKQSWREWAGDKLRRKGSYSAATSVEKLSLFPGWATRKYDTGEEKGAEGAFALQLFVSGFAASYPLPEYTTRSQRAFMRLARAFASLPKLPDASGSNTPSVGDEFTSRIHLPPTPSDITEETEIAELENSLRRMQTEADTCSSNESSDVSDPPSPLPSSSPNAYFAPPSNGNGQMNLDDVLRQHMTLMDRLQPFWSRSLANRPVRLSVYTSFPVSGATPGRSSPDPSRRPVASVIAHTSPQGSFQANITIPWDEVCIHPGAVYIAFGDANQEHELYIHAELLPTVSPPNASLAAPPLEPSISPIQDVNAQSTLVVPLTHSQIRLISDIDDTIKLSNILGGARTIFRNVFVRHLEELVIKGMGEWYTNMWRKGVRFHYVSNGPFQLLPVINDFIRISNLPQGSIKLRSYAGRSLFNGLLSAPATRKRAGLVEVLDAFDSSRFFLVGDSGEQDLELYAQLASERPNQILAVFIRDASGPTAKPIDDPTGEAIKRAVQKQKRPSGPKRSMSFGFTTPSLSRPQPSMQLHPLPTPNNAISSQATPTQSDYSATPVPCNSVTDRGEGLQAPPPSFQPRRKTASSRSSSINVKAYEDSGVDYISSKPIDDRKAHNTLRSPSDPLPTINSGQIPSTFFDAGIIGTLSDSPPSTSPISTKSMPSPAMTETPTPTRTPPPLSAGQQFDARLGAIQVPGVLRPQEVQALSSTERKRYDLQLRVYKARLLMPSHIPLRIFSDPEECVEADRILGDLGKQGMDAVRSSQVESHEV